MSDLKPCPFCGGKALNLEDDGETSIVCYNPYCSFEGVELTGITWNTRPIEDKLNAKLILLRDVAREAEAILEKDGAPQGLNRALIAAKNGGAL